MEITEMNNIRAKERRYLMGMQPAPFTMHIMLLFTSIFPWGKPEISAGLMGLSGS